MGMATRLRVTRGRSRHRNDRGAAMVEAAIVLPVLILLVAGIIDFGFVLNDKQQVSNATFRAARSMAVDEYTLSPGCGGAGSSDTAGTVCMLRAESQAPGDSWVKIVPPTKMEAGESALLCLAVPANSPTGVLGPLTNDMILTSSRHVRIESSDVDLVPFEDALPSGENWSWCT